MILNVVNQALVKANSLFLCKCIELVQVILIARISIIAAKPLRN